VRVNGFYITVLGVQEKSRCWRAHPLEGTPATHYEDPAINVENTHSEDFSSISLGEYCLNKFVLSKLPFNQGIEKNKWA
jgi:hypothetical protein